MFKNAILYRIAPTWSASVGEIEEQLDGARFVECGASQEKSIGWTEPRGEPHGPLVESVSGQLICKLKIETKAVPGSVLTRKAKERTAQIEASTGRKPGKKEMKSLREDALLALLPDAFPRQTVVWVWINKDAGFLAIDASSQGKADEVVTALVRAIDGLSMTLLNTTVTPQSAMTAWLSLEDQADVPGAFAIERECELKSAAEDKAVVKFKNHHLGTDEVRKHITEGKLPTRVAMSHDGRVGFMLTEAMQLKKITFLEGVFDGQKDDAADGFDADVALATGELNKLIPALIEALGGELVIADGQPASPTIYSDGQPDPLLEQARALVTAPDGKASVSYVQRKLQIGYNRAARLLEDLQTMGVIKSAAGLTGVDA